MRRINIIPGARHNMLVINREVDDERKGRYVSCTCDCGKSTIVCLASLRHNTVKSCGCLKYQTHIKNQTHKMSKTRIYRIWRNIKTRCFNKNVRSYEHYGKRGITICDEWMEFVPFYEWSMKSGYKSNLTIERIDFNKNYSPDNCTWIPLEDQALNTRNNVYIEYKGETRCISEWARIMNIPVGVIVARKKSGWDLVDAITKPRYYRGAKNIKGRFINVNGENLSISSAARKYKIHKSTLLSRISKGIDPNKAVL